MRQSAIKHLIAQSVALSLPEWRTVRRLEQIYAIRIANNLQVTATTNVQVLALQFVELQRMHLDVYAPILQLIANERKKVHAPEKRSVKVKNELKRKARNKYMKQYMAERRRKPDIKEQ